MKYKAYVMVGRDYNLAISASQWRDELLENAEEHNRETYGESYLSKPRDRTVIVVEFEVPDSVFEREPLPVVAGELANTNA
jgi:hypothetical protein